MRLIHLCLALIVFCVLSTAGAEAACKAAGPVLFQDQFDALAPTWGTNPSYHVANGKLAMQPQAGHYISSINNASLYDDVDICAEMTGSAPVIKGSCGGIIFWALDYENYYTVQVSTDGQVSVWRFQKGKWLNQLQQDFAAVHKGANQVNEIHVTTSGSKAAIFVNGALFREISGQPPSGGSAAGLIACSPNNVSATVNFDNFVVSAPPGTQAVVYAKPGEFPHGGVGADCQLNDKALFQDSFKELAPSWGTDQNYRVESGKLVIQPPAGYTTAPLNNTALYDDIDLCAGMSAPAQVKNDCGGVIFWAADNDNFYSLEMSTDGQASVYRKQRGRWLLQLEWQSVAALHPLANQVNALRVQTAGSRARFYVNGQFFGEITGQPPPGGSQVGLIACSSNDASARFDFTNFVVSQPGGGGAPSAGVVAASGFTAVDADCKATDKTQFQDYFKELAASWGSYQTYHVEGGKLVIQPSAGYNAASINNASLYDDVDICTKMSVPTLVKGDCGGIVFWAIDYDNYYALQVSTQGQASVWRLQKGKWLNQVEWQDFAAIRAAANQVNTLRVVTAGGKAQFFINGKLFKELSGQPPTGGSQVGLIACSPDSTSARVEFTNFIVSTPGGAAPPEPKAAPPPVIASAGSATKCEAGKDALFTDKFATLDASWGTYDNYKVDNGEFLITPPAGFNTMALNTASLYDDVDLCAGMKARAPVAQGTCGALVFWAEDYDNYYSFQLSTDGQASFWRRQRGKWLEQINWQAADGANSGDGFNQLRVVTAGRAAKLFINGKLFKEVQGQPPAGGQQIGLMACAPDKQAAAVGFDDLVVAAPAGSAGGAKVAVNNAGGKVADAKVAEANTGDKVAENKVEDKKSDAVDQGVATPQGRRVALVIGIGAYKAVPELPNPPRDAADIAGELSAIGFEVTHLDNLDAPAMRKALRDFEQKADGASIAVIYYAGHGMEVNGVNYLIPVDAALDRDTDVEDEAISLNRVLSAVAGARDLRLVLLDACRNNPFAAKMARADGTRAVNRGLARIEPGGSTLVAFSAKEGTTADDGDGRNSPFATALLANLNKRGLEINFLFRRVRDQVMAQTGNRQEPFVYGSLSEVPIYLAGQ